MKLNKFEISEIVYFFLLPLIFFIPITISGQITVMTQNFDASSSLPTGWTQESVSGTDVWTINNGGYNDLGSNHPASAYSGTRNAFLFSSGNTTRKLVPTVLNLAGLGNVTLTFYEARLQWGLDKDNLKVYYKTSSSGSWTQLASYTSATTGWTKRTITLPNPGSTYYIAFEGIAKYGYGVCIDDVKITGEIANDAGVMYSAVANRKYLKVAVKNFGSDNLTSVKVKWIIDNGNIDSLLWTGNKAQSDIDTFVIDTQNFSNGIHYLKFWTERPNTKEDGVPTNDTFWNSYTIISGFPYTESFETGAGEWEQATNDNMNWTRNKNQTPTYGTGPSSAHDGQYYFYTESSGFLNKTAVFNSPDLDISSLTNPYLEIWYHMYGTSMGSLHFDMDTGVIVQDISSSISGNQGDVWVKELIDLSSFKNILKFSIRGITGNNFLSDMAFDDIKIFDMPFINFGNDTVMCQGSTFSLSAPNGLGFSYCWIDVLTQDTISTSQYFATDSSAYIACVVSGAYGYFATDTIKIDIRPNPIVLFNIDDSSQCLTGNYFSLTNSSTISSGSLTYQWDFGDGSNAASSNFNKTYLSSDTFSIKLVAISNYFCSDSISKTVVVKPSPVADFSINDSIQCVKGNQFIFTDQTTGVISSNLSYNWDFGNNQQSSNSSPSMVYSVDDTFLVKLVTTTNLGCVDSVTHNVYIYPNPNTQFTINDSNQCLSGNSFLLTNNSNISSGSISYNWNFGDNTTSSNTNYSKSYSAANVYDISLTATSNYGCTDTLRKLVVVNPSPVANFNISDPDQCLNGNNFTYSNQTTGVQSSNLSYVWDYGDGNSSSFISPTYSYANDGDFDVKMVASSNFGCKDSITKTVNVYPDPFTDFTISDTNQCLNGNSFTFSNKSTIGSGSLNYNWNFGNGQQSSSVNPLYSYLSIGTYTVKLTSTSQFGCTSNLSKDVIVNPDPIAAFSINDAGQCQEGNQFIFSNQSTVSNGTMTYQWDFGDGSMDNQQSSSHHYGIDGDFSVKLVATSTYGCKDSITKTVSIYPEPVSDFEVNDTSQCFNTNSFSFINKSIVNKGTLSYTWGFGDGHISFVKDPVYSYNSAKTYEVYLISESAELCIDTFKQKVYVRPMPVAVFDISDSLQCLNSNKFLFSNTSSVSSGTLNFDWDFGNNQTSTDKNPNISYTNAGNYKVKLLTQTIYGCSDSFERQVKVNNNPTANFSVNDFGQCLENNIFEFKNTSQPDTGIIKFQWKIDNVNKSNDTVFSNSFDKSGKYKVKFIVTNIYTCIDSMVQEVEVYPQPYVFLGNDTSLKKNQAITLKAGGGFQTYDWSNGDKTENIMLTGSDLVAGNNEYWVKVSDLNGCIGGDTINIFYDTTNSISNIVDFIQVKIYPNPTHEILYVEVADILDENITLMIYDLNGKVVYGTITKQNSDVIKINLSQLPTGSYLLRLISENKTTVSKFILE